MSFHRRLCLLQQAKRSQPRHPGFCRYPPEKAVLNDLKSSNQICMIRLFERLLFLESSRQPQRFHRVTGPCILVRFIFICVQGHDLVWGQFRIHESSHNQYSHE
eukprot:Blabericola_migrator_1__7086@NODE_3595_length_1653_cov_3_829130_g2232_i0_p2_GENE_NODE_3595_length_1653_cov_3_829130_g2232_i0NODE_3595_length_1653_cov_3_829130_g2232_i0_p2_ORF_typecomplete_len104_score3_29Cytochrome_B/PF00033_19/0_021_NODE_3595_length_1653_cov_3_829130_g2232_i011081419